MPKKSDAPEPVAQRPDAAIDDRIRALVRSTFGPQVVERGGGPAGMFSLKGAVGLFMRNLRDPLLVTAAAGIGAKRRVAAMAGSHHTVGIDLVARAVNEISSAGAEPLFFLDYLAGAGIGDEVRVNILRGVAEGCRDSGMALLGGATADAPDAFKPGAWDLSGAAVGIVERSRRMTAAHVAAGDAIIGLASSGLHADGYETALETLIDGKGLALADAPPELGGVTLGTELLRSSRIYVAATRAVLGYYRKKYALKAMVPVAAGGLDAALRRLLPEGIAAHVDTRQWTQPPVFDFIRKTAGLDRPRMFREFNMGVGMLMVCGPIYAHVIQGLLRRTRFPAFVIGEIVKGEGEVEIA
jgi:phosphoribosylformylglycinamidine cyclo-ligase